MCVCVCLWGVGGACACVYECVLPFSHFLYYKELAGDYFVANDVVMSML